MQYVTSSFLFLGDACLEHQISISYFLLLQCLLVCVHSSKSVLILKVKSNSLSSLYWNNEKVSFLWINKSFSCCNPISRLDEASPLRSVHFFRRFKSCQGFCFVVKSWFISLDINTSFQKCFDFDLNLSLVFLFRHQG